MARNNDGVSLTKLIVHFAKAEPTSQSANPNHLKTERLENKLRLCGECWPNSSKISSLMEMTKVPVLSLRSTPADKSSVSRFDDTALETCVQSCPFWTLTCLHQLQQTCVFLVFLVKCCSGSSLKPTQPVCDGRPVTSPIFCRLAGRGAFLRGYPFRWVLHFALSFDSLPDRA